MPIYQYECEKCGHLFDDLREINGEDEELKCPKCGAEEVRRIFSTFNSFDICAPSRKWSEGGGG